MAEEEVTRMYELLDALEETMKATDPAKREALAKTIDTYHEDFPDKFHCAIGAQAPALLYHLFKSIDTACGPTHNRIRVASFASWIVSQKATHRTGAGRRGFGAWE
jgi:hypothetical protein